MSKIYVLEQHRGEGKKFRVDCISRPPANADARRPEAGRRAYSGPLPALACSNAAAAAAVGSPGPPVLSLRKHQHRPLASPQQAAGCQQRLAAGRRQPMSAAGGCDVRRPATAAVGCLLWPCGVRRPPPRDLQWSAAMQPSKRSLGPGSDRPGALVPGLQLPWMLLDL